MLRFIVRRLGIMLVTLYLITTATFFLMKAAPGDPFAQEKAIPEEILKALRSHYKLDRPWYVQYGHYLYSVATWDLGPSFKYQGRTVNAIIRQGFPVSAVLGLQALTISLFAGTFFGVVAAYYQNKIPDYLSMVIAIVGLSVPSFLLAAGLQYLFAMKWHLLPVARWGTFSQSILPSLALSALPIAYIARLCRANMIEVLHQDYIKTAKAKGLSPRRILWVHALRNSMLPVVSYLGPLTANVLTGSFIVEQIFGIPGLGQWFVSSITNRDYTVIMGTTVFYGLILLVAIFLTDIAYALLDPRIKLTNQGDHVV